MLELEMAAAILIMTFNKTIYHLLVGLRVSVVIFRKLHYTTYLNVKILIKKGPTCSVIFLSHRYHRTYIRYFMVVQI